MPCSGCSALQGANPILNEKQKNKKKYKSTCYGFHEKGLHHQDHLLLSSYLGKATWKQDVN